jgi:hypothetical protein
LKPPQHCDKPYPMFGNQFGIDHRLESLQEPPHRQEFMWCTAATLRTTTHSGTSARPGNSRPGLFLSAEDAWQISAGNSQQPDSHQLADDSLPGHISGWLNRAPSSTNHDTAPNGQTHPSSGLCRHFLCRTPCNSETILEFAAGQAGRVQYGLYRLFL